MKIKIRKVALCDVKSLLPLISQLGYPIKEEDLIARIALYQHSINDYAWVALDEEEIIGCVALHLFDFFHSTERYARIVSLVIKDPYRGKGVGSRLIARAERFAKEKGCSTLEVTSSLKRAKLGVHTFYAHRGYANEGVAETRYLRKFLKPKEGPSL